MADEVEGAKKRKNPRKPRAKAKGDSKTGKGTPWTFPKYSLENAINLAKAIEEKNGGVTAVRRSLLYP